LFLSIYEDIFLIKKPTIKENQMKSIISQIFFILISITVHCQINLSEGLLAIYPFNSTGHDENPEDNN